MLIVSVLFLQLISSSKLAHTGKEVPDPKHKLGDSEIPKIRNEMKKDQEIKRSDYPKESEEKPNHVIFYNIFVNKERYKDTLDIISEQISQVLKSSHRNSSLYFNVWGQDIPDSNICPPELDCKRIRYQEEGSETETIQNLYEHCLAHPKDTVVYMHDKGSFNPSGNNVKLRKIATKSALSDACKSAPSKGCNVCANRFQFLPNHHTPANMWTATCDYVRLLIPPKDFDEKRRAMFRDVRNNATLQDQLYCVKALVKDFEQGEQFGNDQWKYMSIYRYAMENWVFSHPYLSVCHTITKLHKINPKSWTPSLTVGVGPATLGFERATTTGWYQLEGRKFEYQYLYGLLPQKTSFFWDVYKKAIVLPRDRIKC